MLNKIKKLIVTAKFNRAQNKRFAGVLDQNFDLENNSGILRTSILVAIANSTMSRLRLPVG